MKVTKKYLGKSGHQYVKDAVLQQPVASNWQELMQLANSGPLIKSGDFTLRLNWQGFLVLRRDQEVVAGLEISARDLEHMQDLYQQADAKLNELNSQLQQQATA